METVKEYLDAGVKRVIIGTAAVNDKAFLENAIKTYGDKIAVGVDVKDGFVAIKGWVEKSNYDGFEFCGMMQDAGVKYIICTDISKDGAMKGTNRELYKELSNKFNLNITASGGVSSMDDVLALNNLGLYGAIIGKAYYVNSIDLKEAVEATK